MKKPNACSLSGLFPPEDKAKWEKGHGRIDRRRVARVAVSPEQIGLCGCWQVIVIERESIDSTKPGAPVDRHIRYYVTSLAVDERTDQEIIDIIRGHWSGSENGTHYRRDVTFQEDKCRVADPKGAPILASLRNLANGAFELAKARGRTTVDTLNSWCQRQTFSMALAILNS